MYSRFTIISRQFILKFPSPHPSDVVSNLLMVKKKKKKTNTMPTLGIPGRARILMSPFDQRIKLFLPPFLSLCPFLFLPFFHECSGIEELSLEVWTSKKIWI